MIEQFDRELIERINHAIQNIRLIASRVKRQYVIEAVQGAEDVVKFLDEFRKYVYALEEKNYALASIMRFNDANETKVRWQIIKTNAHALYTLLTVENRKVYKDEHRQVELLFEDIGKLLNNMVESRG